MIRNDITLPFPKIVGFINTQLKNTCYRFDIERDGKNYYLSKVQPLGDDFVKNPFGVCVAKFDMKGRVFLIDDTLQTPETLSLLNYISDCIVDYNNL